MWTTALLCRGVLWYKPPLTRTRKVHWTNNKTWMINLINLSTKLLKARTQEHRPLEPFQDSNWETRHSERLSYFEIREVVTWGLRFLKQSATPRDSWSRTKLIWLHCGRHKDDLPGSERSESLSCPTVLHRSQDLPWGEGRNTSAALSRGGRVPCLHHVHGPDKIGSVMFSVSKQKHLYTRVYMNVHDQSSSLHIACHAQMDMMEASSITMWLKLANCSGFARNHVRT